MCGCSSNFDGTSGIEEMEKRVFLDFDGEDDDFDGFLIKRKNKSDLEKLLRAKERLEFYEIVKSILTTDNKTLSELRSEKPENYKRFSVSNEVWNYITSKYIEAINKGIPKENAFIIVYPEYTSLPLKIKALELKVDGETNDNSKSRVLIEKNKDRPTVFTSTASTKPVSKPKADAIKNDIEVKGTASTKPVSKPKADAIKDDVEVKGAVDTTDADENKKADDIRVKNINENFFLRNKTSLMIGGGVLLALGVGFIVYRKMKK